MDNNYHDEAHISTRAGRPIRLGWRRGGLFQVIERLQPARRSNASLLLAPYGAGMFFGRVI